MKATIHLEENLKIKTNSKGEVLSTESKGVLKVINPSKSTVLWGVELKTNHGEDIIEFQDTTIPHVDAGGFHSIEYNTKLEPKVEIKEDIDTNFDGNEFNSLNRDLIHGTNQAIACRISVKNNYHINLKNITVEKQLPQDTKEIRAVDPFSGDINIIEEERVATWIIPILNAGEEVEIILTATCAPNTLQAFKTGNIISRFETDNVISSLDPAIEGDCDNIDLALETKETITPLQWQVNLGLRNASEFEIFLKNVKLEVNGEEKFFENVSQELDGNMDEPIWTKSVAVESEGFPEITKMFDYHVLYEITKHSSITLEKESDQIYVIKAGVSKTFEPTKVTTYAITDIIATIDITNIGSATIGKIEVEDTIPSYIEIDEVTAETVGRILEVDFVERPKKAPVPVIEDRESATFETIDETDFQEEAIEEDYIHVSEDISQERQYHYVISDLKLEPGQIIKVKVKGKANKPKAEGSHSASAKIKAYSTQPTKPFVCEAEMEGRIPTITVEFKQRSYKITSIFTKQSLDSYNIEIPITNNGDVVLDNVVVIQPIFTAEYFSHTPPTVDVTIEGSNIKCKIKRIMVGETITINLNIRTSGPLRQQQATIRI